MCLPLSFCILLVLICGDHVFHICWSTTTCFKLIIVLNCLNVDLRDLHFLLPSPTFCVFDVILYSFMYILKFCIVATVAFANLLLLAYLSDWSSVPSIILPFLVGLALSCCSFFFLLQKTLYHLFWCSWALSVVASLRVLYFTYDSN